MAEQSRKKPIIELKNIIKEFRVGKNTIRVLKDINARIEPQEFIIILGPSGSGKSTLLNTIIGLERPTSGQVLVANEDLTTLSSDKLAAFRLQNYGVVYQRPDWIKALNIVQNVAFPLAIANHSMTEAIPKAIELLKRFGMDDHAEYAPSELSGGQQQKCEIARSLIMDPDIVIADEPTGNLDTDSAERVMNIFTELREKDKKTVIMVTHNIEYVRYATHTIYVRDGRVLEGEQSFGTKKK
ncbi:MAG: ABC transporter ATP-binding protein [Candidatus Nomurabacteria bacterium]|nr:MAG: ABC transporter ATP-binding protein [Candidatus Nomurabacteria bacterium]